MWGRSAALQRSAAAEPAAAAAAAHGRAALYLGEKAVFARGSFNAILTGAAFVDGQLAAQLYWSDAAAAARAAVDRRLNCEDILLNFLLASHNRAAAVGHDSAARGGESSNAATALWARPRRRLDLSRLTPSGLSRAPGHSEARAACAAEFQRLLGGWPLREVGLDGTRGRPWCPFSGCIYL